jgi:nicotinamide-nucleotide amidase
MAGMTISRAAILAVGSELLTPTRVDTNSLFITEQLNLLGIGVIFKCVIGDDRKELARAVRMALDQADLVVCTGGLGPTDDDVTREVVAEVLRRPLDQNPEVASSIRARFASRGLPMPAINLRQAEVPAGARVLPNPNGTAPGLWLEDNGRIIVLLPGPPRELKPMLVGLVTESLRERAGGFVLLRRVIRITGRTESQAEQSLQPLYAEWGRRSVSVAAAATILAAHGQIELHLSARTAARGDADAALNQAVADVQMALGTDVYSIDGSTLEQVVGFMLVERGMRIGVAESCTGGLVTSRLTDVAGSSRYVERSVVAYSNEAKSDWLDVPAHLIAAHGAVSEAVALAMAAGITSRARVDVGVGVTGIAGPGGGSPEKPVGTVAVAVQVGSTSRARTFRFIGERELVKFQASQAALDMLRRLLLES